MIDSHVFFSRPFSLAVKIIFLILVAPGMALAQPPQQPDAQPQLVILNWSEYMDPEVVSEFERKYGVQVREIYYASDDARDEIMLETEGHGFDLILINGSKLNSYIKRGWIAPLVLDRIPNRKHIEQRWLHAYENAAQYGMPYFWGTLGIAYRADLAPDPITSWRQLFEPAPALQGKIMMINSSMDLVGMALKALGYSLNSSDPEELAQAERLLLKQKPYVAEYSYPVLDESSSLVTGEIVAAMVYGGDALNIAEHYSKVKYVLPVEGGNIWVDYFTVAANSENHDLAHRFLDFIHEPKIAARLAEQLYLATPNSSAKLFLSKEHLQDPVIYPGEELLKKSEFYSTVPGHALRIRSGIHARTVN